MKITWKREPSRQFRLKISLPLTCFLTLALMTCLVGTAAAKNPHVTTASFSASPTSGQAPLAVQFTDASTGRITSRSWNFGDGTTSTAQSPSHTYSTAGSYVAKLTVTNSSGSNSNSKTITVTALSLPTANFSASPTSGQAPLAVQFTDASTGTITSRSWDFGDSTASTAQSPSHTYSTAGSYAVKLTVSNASGSSYKIASITVTAPTPPPTPPPTGTTYYIDATGGNDSWAGTSAQPWKSIARVNSTSLPAGASVLFNRGGVWTETLQPANGGGIGSPIVFGAYGTGPLPIIDGQNTRLPVVINNNYITLQDLEIKNSSGNGAQVLPSKTNVTNVLLQRLTTHDNIKAGISIQNDGSTYSVSNISVTNCTSYNNGMEGIAGSLNIDHVTVSYNKVYHNGLRPVPEWGWHGISFYGSSTSNRPSYIVIEHNEVYDQQEGSNSSSKEGAGIQTDDNCDHMIIRYNYLHNNQGPGITTNKNTYVDVYYNLCVNNGNGSVTWTGGLYITNSSHINAYNNVFYGDLHYGSYAYDDTGMSSDIAFRNNVFMNNGLRQLRVYTSSGSAIPNFTSNNNCFFSSDAYAFEYLNQGTGNLSWWQGKGFDLQSRWADPMFVNMANGDFHLQTTSPCREIGVDVGLALDYYGTKVPQGTYPDAGASEFYLY